MTQTSRITADDLAEDILARQGSRLHADDGQDMQCIVAQCTAKQASYLYSLIERDYGRDVFGREHGHRVAVASGWTLQEHLYGSAALVAYKPLDWHPLDYQEYTYRPPS